MNRKSCLIVIDVQKGIFKLKQPVYNENALMQTLAKAIAFARANKIKIIYTQHENNSFLKRESDPWQIIDGLYVNDDDMILSKKHPSIFKETELHDYLQKENISTLLIAGLISNGCVEAACLDALSKQYEVILIKDAHSTFYKDAEKIIKQINEDMSKKGINVISLKDLRVM